MQILTIIALLCQLNGTSEPKQLDCQKTYIKCLRAKNGGKLITGAMGGNTEETLAKCVEEKQ